MCTFLAWVCLKAGWQDRSEVGVTERDVTGPRDGEGYRVWSDQFAMRIPIDREKGFGDTIFYFIAFIFLGGRLWVPCGVDWAMECQGRYLSVSGECVLIVEAVVCPEWHDVMLLVSVEGGGVITSVRVSLPHKLLCQT